MGLRRLASAGATAASRSRVAGARLGQLQALGLAGVGAQDAEAAGVRQHGDARAGRQWL